MGNDRALIRELFGTPRADYSEEDAVRLIGTSITALEAAIRNGEMEPRNALRRHAWSHVAAFAVETRWTPRMIDEALRPDLLDRVPKLNRMTTMFVRVPIYQARFLTWQATRTVQWAMRATADDILTAAIDGSIASLEIDAAIEQDISGFRAAVDWPLNPEEDAP